MLDLAGKEVPFFKNNYPGKARRLGFLSRHPDLKHKNAENLDLTRAADCNEGNISLWHKQYKNLSLEYNITSPEYICNCDESGFSLQPKSGKILVDTKLRNPYFLTGKDKSQITALVCTTASGKILSPFLLFPGRQVNPSFALDLPAHSKCYPPETRWMTKELFHEWIKNLFIPYWADPNSRGHVLLLLDGHASHISLKTSKLCSENKIQLFRIPPNTTHLIQPLDKGFFGPFKANWKKE